MATYEWGNLKAVWSDDDRNAAYYREALEHAGIPFVRCERVAGQELAGCSTLLLFGSGTLTAPEVESVGNFVLGGGSLVASGTHWGLQDVLGLTGKGTFLSNAVMKPENEDRLWPEGATLARFFGGTVYGSTGSQVLAMTPEGPTLTRHGLGQGTALYVAPHVGQSFAMMALGRSVETDGVGASDGSARLDDGVLRAEDGAALDFDRDRIRLRDGTAFFAYPHADVVREIWLRAVVEAIERSRKPSPIFWHWPRGAQAVACLSLDCETFEPEGVARVQRVLTMFGCQPAWMVAQPGYSLDVYRTLRNWEHEIGLLFSTDDAAGWHEERLKIQVVSVSRASTNPSLASVRPVDGRWRGWTSFYEMAEAAGARVSVAKGGRQPGTSGFLFGTSHPFFPVRANGTGGLVMELPYTAYLPGVITPDAVADAILAQTLRRNGCFHLVTRPEAFDDQHALNSLQRILGLCRQMRMPFLKPDEILRHERGRRSLRTFYSSGVDGAAVGMASEQGLDGLTVLLPGEVDEVLVRGRVASTRAFEAYGTRFTAVDLNLESRQMSELKVLGKLSVAV